MRHNNKINRGFTLVELVMVIAVIAMLAAIVVPRFASQRDYAAIATTKANLESLRTAVDVYYAQEDQWPTALSDLLVAAPITGNIYLRKMPEERITPGGSTAEVGAYDGTGGWIYDTATQEVLPNFSGNDANGDDYTTY